MFVNSYVEKILGAGTLSSWTRFKQLAERLISSGLKLYPSPPPPNVNFWFYALQKNILINIFNFVILESDNRKKREKN